MTTPFLGNIAAQSRWMCAKTEHCITKIVIAALTFDWCCELLVSYMVDVIFGYLFSVYVYIYKAAAAFLGHPVPRLVVEGRALV